LHPATRLIGWLALLLAVQCLSGAALLAACLAVPLSGARVRQRGVRLVWRTRWLLISLLIIFSWGVAGEPLWSGGMAPTREGVDEALKHVGRLFLVLFAVAAFLEFMPFADLLAGTRTVLAPLRRLGVDSDRGVARLMLALRYAETLPRPRDWRVLLDVPETIAGEEILEIERRPLRWIDGGVIAGWLAGLVWLWLRSS
jgi:energy-coupling factor transporter transmembrane protein EcfT